MNTQPTHVYANGVRISPRELEESRLAALCAWLRGRVLGGVRIHEARAEVGPGAYETVVHVTVLLDDPPPGCGTWRFPAIDEMERRVRDQAWQLGLDEWTHLIPVEIRSAKNIFSDEEIARARAVSPAP